MPAPILKNPFIGPQALFNYQYDNANDQWVAIGSVAQQVTTVGSGTTGTDRSASVATTAAQLMPANANRTRLIIKNDGANAIWVNLGGTAAATAGGGNYKIASGGGFLEIQGYTGAVSAIAETSAVNVSAREL